MSGLTNDSNNDYMMVQVLSPKIAILFYKENTLKKLKHRLQNLCGLKMLLLLQVL